MQIRNIQVLRGLAALAVLLSHINIFEGKYFGSSGVTPAIFGQGIAGVDLFFVISGFIMVYIQPVRIDSLAMYGRFMIHRLTRIYPPYWLATLMLLPLWLFHPEMINNYYHNHVEIVRSFLLFPQDYTPLLGVGWTLIHEVYFYLVVSFALMLGSRGRWLFGCTWFFIVLVVFIGYGKDGFHSNRILQLVFSPFSLNFLLGYFVGLLSGQIMRASRSFAVCMLLVSITGFAIGFATPWPYPVGVYPDNNNLFRLVAYGGPAALLVIAAIALESYLPRLVLRLDKLGDISYATYLIHGVLVAGFYRSAAALHITGFIPKIITAVMCVVGSLLLAMVFHVFLEMKASQKCRKALESFFHLKNNGKTA